MTQQEKERSCELIEGYVYSSRSATETDFVNAKNELIDHLKRTIACATMTSFEDFQYHFKTHSGTVKP